jgi:hypothetical protein
VPCPLGDAARDPAERLAQVVGRRVLRAELVAAEQRASSAAAA